MRFATVIAIVLVLAARASAQFPAPGQNQFSSYGQIPATTVYGPPSAVNQVLTATSTASGVGQATAAFVDTCSLLAQTGCPGVGPGIIVHTLGGTTPTFIVNSGAVPAIDVENDTLAASIVSITTPRAGAMADGEIIQAKFVQPAGGHDYTLPGTITAGSGTTVVFTSGCATMPSMPLGIGHGVLFGMVYNKSIAELDVVSCVTTGS